MTIEAMKQALEALNTVEWHGGGSCWIVDGEAVDEAVEALRQAIADFEKQEPVVWMYQDKSTHEVRFQKHMRGFVDHGATYETPLYTTPQPKREPLTIEQLLEHWRVAKVLDMTDAEIDFADYVLIARDVEALYGITSDMKQEHVAKTAKQRHEENT